MPWARLDDSLDDHQKIQAISNDALAVWACALTFSNRKRTDGFLSQSDVRRVLGLRQAPDSVIDELVAVPTGFASGLWERKTGGYQIHDFAQYNKTRAQLDKEADDAKARMERFRQNGRQPEPDRPDPSEERSDVVTRERTHEHIKEQRHEQRGEQRSMQHPLPGSRIPDPEIPDPSISAPKTESTSRRADAPTAEAVEESASKPLNFPKAIERQMWDALGIALGHTPNGKNTVERAPWNVAIKALLAAGETPETIGKLVALYLERFPGIECTPMALAKHQSLLRSKPLTPPNVYDGPLYQRPAMNGTPETVPLDRRREIGAMTRALSGEKRPSADPTVVATEMAAIRAKIGTSDKPAIRRPTYPGGGPHA